MIRNLEEDEKEEFIQHGRGIQVWPNGAQYDGLWNEGKIEGQGRLIHCNGDIIEGEFKNDKANGYAKFSKSHGLTYEGFW